ncbi:MAG: FIST N-terminal domain-containing protein [Rhodocyclaceae bacterium]
MSTPALAAAHAFGSDASACLDTCLASLSLPRGANLGFVYFSDQHIGDAEQILASLRERTGIPEWVGSSAIGIIGEGAAMQDGGGISVMAARFAPGSFSVFSGRKPLPHGADKAYFAVVHADPGTPDMADLVADMAGKVASGFVTGGLSSGRGGAVQIADDVLRGGMSGVAFSGSVAIVTRLTQGCAPLPRQHVITRAERNLVGYIDGRRALDVFKEAAGAELAQDLPRAAQTILVGLSIPGRDSEDYLVRNVVGIDPQTGLLALNEYVETGRPLRFVRRDAESARQDLQRVLSDLRASLTSAPKGGLYFSCVGRGRNLFGDDSVEPELIRRHLGNFPLTGFFCNGEISHDQLYSYTGVLTLFL